MISVSIVEDDDNSAKILTDFLSKYSEESGVHFSIIRFKDGLSFLDNYQKTDLIFMDIEMPMMNGMTAAEKLRKIDTSAVLIFVTNMAKYAVQGYSVNALDFMVKPISYSDFIFKIKRALHSIKAIKNDAITLQLKDGIHRLHTDDVTYIEVHGHTLTYHLENETLNVRGTLSEAAKQFGGFLKCNSCYLVNPKHIDWVKGYEVKVGNDILAISRPKRKDFMNELSTWYSKGGI